MFQHKLLTALCEKQDLMLRDMVRSFVNDQIMPVRQQIDDDENHIIVGQILQKLASPGFLKNIFPEKYGGGGGLFSAVATSLATEEIARGDSGISVALGCCIWPFLPAVWARNEAVLDHFAPMFCSGELKIGCFNMTEPGGPSGEG